jgi:hypothetical protein
MYHVTIKWLDGTTTNATVNAATIRGFRLTACKGASVSIIKVKS